MIEPSNISLLFCETFLTEEWENWRNIYCEPFIIIDDGNNLYMNKNIQLDFYNYALKTRKYDINTMRRLRKMIDNTKQIYDKTYEDFFNSTKFDFNKKDDEINKLNKKIKDIISNNNKKENGEKLLKEIIKYEEDKKNLEEIYADKKSDNGIISQKIGILTKIISLLKNKYLLFYYEENQIKS